MTDKTKWTKMTDLPKDTRLDGMRVRYKKHVLGYIRSGWNRGLWLTQERASWGGVQPWFPPEGGTMADVAGELEVEV